MLFAEKLKNIREANNLSCTELATKSGVSVVTIYGYERGSIIPTMPTITRLVKSLKLSLAEFDEVDFPLDGRNQRKGKRDNKQVGENGNVKPTKGKKVTKDKK